MNFGTEFQNTIFSLDWYYIVVVSAGRKNVSSGLSTTKREFLKKNIKKTSISMCLPQISLQREIIYEKTETSCDPAKDERTRAPTPSPRRRNVADVAPARGRRWLDAGFACGSCGTRVFAAPRPATWITACDWWMTPTGNTFTSQCLLPAFRY